MGDHAILVQLLAVIAVLGACGGPAVKNPTFVGAPGTQLPPLAPEYRITAGDRLAVKFFYNADLNQEVLVRPDGRISLQLVQEVMAAGRTPAELTEELTTGYSKHLEQPKSRHCQCLRRAKNLRRGEVGAPGLRELWGRPRRCRPLPPARVPRHRRKMKSPSFAAAPRTAVIIALNLSKA